MPAFNAERHIPEAFSLCLRWVPQQYICTQEILKKAGRLHALGSLEENDPDADEEVLDEEDEDEGESGQTDAQTDAEADELAAALAAQAAI